MSLAPVAWSRVTEPNNASDVTLCSRRSWSRCAARMRSTSSRFMTIFCVIRGGKANGESSSFERLSIFSKRVLRVEGRALDAPLTIGYKIAENSVVTRETRSPELRPAATPEDVVDALSDHAALAPRSRGVAPGFGGADTPWTSRGRRAPTLGQASRRARTRRARRAPQPPSRSLLEGQGRSLAAGPADRHSSVCAPRALLPPSRRPSNSSVSHCVAFVPH
jgi:hypothetical protein